MSEEISEMYGVDLQKHKQELMAELEKDEDKSSDKGNSTGINVEDNIKWKS